MLRKAQRAIARFFRWLFGRPVQELPPEFGPPVPPDLRVFEGEMQEEEHEPTGTVPRDGARPPRKRR